MNKIAKTFLILTVATVIVTGCGKQESNETSVGNDSISTNIINTDNEAFRKEFEKFIKGESLEYSNYFLGTITISEEDVNYKYNIIDTYSSQNAVYIKISVDEEVYMYRFQMNENGKIESYIKYELEA